MHLHVRYTIVVLTLQPRCPRASLHRYLHHVAHTSLYSQSATSSFSSSSSPAEPREHRHAWTRDSIRGEWGTITYTDSSSESFDTSDARNSAVKNKLLLVSSTRSLICTAWTSNGTASVGVTSISDSLLFARAAAADSL
uniref:Uncharacterized protein n=1 Tax=Hyaloperonospora arabidopsidis (strain Emoy2) TaxID=559515 RepID=M4BYC7_HYAAE